jgi:hypothetical protein
MQPSIRRPLAAVIQTPTPLAAVETAAADLTAKVEALRAALPPPFFTVMDAANVMKLSVLTMRHWIG